MSIAARGRCELCSTIAPRSFVKRFDSVMLICKQCMIYTDSIAEKQAAIVREVRARQAGGWRVGRTRVSYSYTMR